MAIPAGDLGDRAVRSAAPTPRSSPKPGTPPGSTRSATFPAIAGPSGTAGTATTCGGSSRAMPGCSARSPAGSRAAPTSIRRAATCRSTASTSSPAHDGFTLNDLVTYNEKHNEANGEGNHDGSDDNLSWNCGVEGATDDSGDRGAPRAADQELRDDPDALAGRADVRRRRRGPPHPAVATTTPTARTTPISWFDWTLVEQQRRPAALLATDDRLPPAAPGVAPSRFFTGQVNERGLPDIPGTACQLDRARLERPAGPRRWPSRWAASQGRPDLHMMMNMYWDGLDFELPGIDGRRWHRAVDTAAASPDDIADPGAEVPLGRCQQLHRRPPAASSCSSPSPPDPPVSNREKRAMKSFDFTFSDLVAGYVTAVAETGDGFDLVTSDGRPITIAITLDCVRGSRAQPRRAVPGCHGRDAHMLVPGRYLFAYGVFYPDGPERSVRFEAKHLVFLGQSENEFVLRAPGLVDQAGSPAGRLLPWRPVR